MLDGKQTVATVARLSARAGLWGPLRWGLGGAMIGLPFAAYDAANQERGEKLPTLAGRTLGLMTLPLTAGAFTSGLCLIPGIGPGAAAIVGAVAALYPNARFQDVAARAFRRFSRLEQDVRRLEMGGRYVDSASAEASRMAAIQEMNATLVASRRYLGQEAAIFHR